MRWWTYQREFRFMPGPTWASVISTDKTILWAELCAITSGVAKCHIAPRIISKEKFETLHSLSLYMGLAEEGACMPVCSP